MLKILGRVTSINVRKALWAADALGLAYEQQDWGLPLRDPNVPEFLALNPNAQVPVLIEDGFVLWESNAILVYLAERHGGLLPEDPQQRGLVLQWLGWQATELNPHWSYPLMWLVRQAPAFNDPAKIAAGIARWSAKMAILEAQLTRNGQFVAGDSFTIADIALALSVHRWFATPFEKPSLPAVEAYYTAMRVRPEGGRWMADATP